MDAIVWRSEYPAEIVSLLIVNQPRQATIRIAADCGSTVDLSLTNPLALGAVCSALDNCYEVRVFDERAESQSQVEFGRYRVEFWDEDNPIAATRCDEFKADNAG